MSTIASDNAPLRIALIVASVRPQRFADVLLPWLTGELSASSRYRLDILDLAEIDLPPTGLVPGGAASPISDRLADADGFVILTPEYNHSFPAALKNAIDWHFTEWQRKPVAFVAYGSHSGGSRAIEQLRAIFPELMGMTVRNAVAIVSPWERLDGDGRFDPGPTTDAALHATIDELLWWAATLRAGRRTLATT